MRIIGQSRKDTHTAFVAAGIRAKGRTMNTGYQRCPQMAHTRRALNTCCIYVDQGSFKNWEGGAADGSPANATMAVTRKIACKMNSRWHLKEIRPRVCISAPRLPFDSKDTRTATPKNEQKYIDQV